MIFRIFIVGSDFGQGYPLTRLFFLSISLKKLIIFPEICCCFEETMQTYHMYHIRNCDLIPSLLFLLKTILGAGIFHIRCVNTRFTSTSDRVTVSYAILVLHRVLFRFTSFFLSLTFTPNHSFFLIPLFRRRSETELSASCGKNRFDVTRFSSPRRRWWR